MPLKSTSSRYGSVAILIHWTSALAIILALGAGLVGADTVVPLQQVAILRAHVVLGSLVLILTLLRILWWIVADRHPALPADQPHWQQLAAKAVHYAIYGVILLLGTSGITMLALSGALGNLLAGTPIPDLSGLVPRIAHGLLGRLMLLLLVGHIGAAIYHQFVRRDHLLARMGIGAEPRPN